MPICYVWYEGVNLTPGATDQKSCIPHLASGLRKFGFNGGMGTDLSKDKGAGYRCT